MLETESQQRKMEESEIQDELKKKEMLLAQLEAEHREIQQVNMEMS